MAIDKTEKSSKIPNKYSTHKDSPESSNGEIIIPTTPPRPAGLAGESQGGYIITLALRTPERLRLEPDLAGLYRGTQLDGLSAGYTIRIGWLRVSGIDFHR